MGCGSGCGTRARLGAAGATTVVWGIAEIPWFESSVMISAFKLMPPCLTLLMLAACQQSLPGQLTSCQPYRPHIAKQTFDGRVGAVLVRNASARAAEVKVFHPDGIGDVERSWTVPPGAVLALTGDDGGRLPLGNDWGIQVQQACVATLGQAAEWRPGEFALRWDGDSVMPGLGTGVTRGSPSLFLR
jgi:hypothetical protein